MNAPTTPDMILLNGRITTLDREQPETAALSIRDGQILALGDDRTIRQSAGPETRVSHTHVIRGGLSYNMELR